ncbi:hypothetical protein LCGC14_2806810, partial [marine sediment metagenome]
MKMENRKNYQNLSKQYVCQNCGIAFSAPMHCGHAMHIAESNGQTEWNCWMGPNCGKVPFEAKCDSPSLT